MTDTDILIRCPRCSGEAREIPELYKTGFKVELPGDAAIEVRFRIYRCNECGKDFSEEDLNNS